MRKLEHSRERFYKITEEYSKLYSFSNRREQLTLTNGVLNFIWNSWNNYWRNYWIAHVSGGLNVDKSLITPIHPNYTDKEACHYLLFACGKRKRHNLHDSISGSHQEATWGDPKIIESIALSLQHQHPQMVYVLGLLSIYKTNIEHLQRIRNSFTHLNNENIYHLNSIDSYYSFGHNHKLIDILESTTISNSTKCFDNIIDNLNGFLQNL